MFERSCRVAVIVAAMLCAGSALAVVGGDVPGPDDYRFDAVAAFGSEAGLLEGHDWWCAATLITESTALLAQHCIAASPGPPFAVRFRRAEDGTIGSVESDPSSFHNVRVTGWRFPKEGDVAIVYLEKAVTHIAPMPLSFGPSFPGEWVTAAGWGREGPGPGEGQKTRLKACETALYAVTAPHLLFLNAWVGGPCGPNNNDSGGALVAMIPSSQARDSIERLGLVGVLNSLGSAVDVAPFEEFVRGDAVDAVAVK